MLYHDDANPLYFAKINQLKQKKLKLQKTDQVLFVYIFVEDENVYTALVTTEISNMIPGPDTETCLALTHRHTLDMFISNLQILLTGHYREPAQGLHGLSVDSKCNSTYVHV